LLGLNNSLVLNVVDDERRLARKQEQQENTLIQFLVKKSPVENVPLGEPIDTSSNFSAIIFGLATILWFPFVYFNSSSSLQNSILVITGFFSFVYFYHFDLGLLIFLQNLLIRLIFQTLSL